MINETGSAAPRLGGLARLFEQDIFRWDKHFLEVEIVERVDLLIRCGWRVWQGIQILSVSNVIPK
jgi:hypothetical protein